MIATTITTGDRRNGRIVVEYAGQSYCYGYHRGTGRARHDLTVYPAATIADHRLADALGEIAVQAAEGGGGSYSWSVERDAEGVTVRAGAVAA